MLHLHQQHSAQGLNSLFPIGHQQPREVTVLFLLVYQFCFYSSGALTFKPITKFYFFDFGSIHFLQKQNPSIQLFSSHMHKQTTFMSMKDLIIQNTSICTSLNLQIHQSPKILPSAHHFNVNRLRKSLLCTKMIIFLIIVGVKMLNHTISELCCKIISVFFFQFLKL